VFPCSVFPKGGNTGNTGTRGYNPQFLSTPNKFGGWDRLD
jgi:hypothetical protein